VSGCICAGNWRLLVEECGPLIGEYFKDSYGGVFRFFGLVHGDEDYYYGLWNITTRELTLASCVGNLEGHGYVPCAAPTTRSCETTLGAALDAMCEVSNPEAYLWRKRYEALVAERLRDRPTAGIARTDFTVAPIAGKTMPGGELLKEDVPNWSKGPRAQAMLGGRARLSLELSILEDILAGQAEFTALDLEYWNNNHDRAYEVMNMLRALVATLAPTDDASAPGLWLQAKALLTHPPKENTDE